MMKAVIIIGIMILVVFVLVIWSCCVVSSKISRMEDKHWEEGEYE